MFRTCVFNNTVWKVGGNCIWGQKTAQKKIKYLVKIISNVI